LKKRFASNIRLFHQISHYGRFPGCTHPGDHKKESSLARPATTGNICYLRTLSLVRKCVEENSTIVDMLLIERG
jgi:hypothetical protein